MAAVWQLVERVIRTTGSRNTDRYHIVDLLNTALRTLADDAKLEGAETVTTVIDQENYSIPSDFKAPIALIEGSISTPEIIYPLVNIDEQRFGYAIYGQEIYLKPSPSEVKTLNIYYYRYPAQLIQDTDVPEIDPYYHDLLAIYAIAQIMLITGFDKGTYDRAYADWEIGRENFLKAQGRKNRQSRVNEKVVW